MFHQHDGFFGGYGGHGIGLFGLLMMIVFWAVVALLFLTLVQNYRRGPHHAHDHAHGHGPGLATTPGTLSPAVDILKERFAKGEVTEEEFTRRLSLLKEN